MERTWNAEQIVLVISLIGLATASEWSYDGTHGPETWSHTYPFCAGSSQSPIDISTLSQELDSLGVFQTTGYDSYIYGASIPFQNNGHTAVIQLCGILPTLSRGGLPATYNLHQFHFHWGKQGFGGSEHTVDGKSYSGEMHLVHVKTEYRSINDALASGDPHALAVVGVFIEEEGTKDNVNFQPLTNYLSNISSYNSAVNVADFRLADLLPSGQTNYYRYYGSLTTPTCNEAVIWTVLSLPVRLSTKQMNAFRDLSDDAGIPIERNFRPLQQLHDRIVYKSSSFIINSSTTVRLNSVCFVVLLMAFLVILQ